MIKVVIDGTAGPYIATGTFVTEDERYLCIDDRGIKVNIPVARIIKIEDMKDVWDAPPPRMEAPPIPTAPVEPARPLHPDPLPAAVAAAIGPPNQPTPNQKQVLDRLGLGNKNDKGPFSHGTANKEPVDVNIIVSGAISRSMTLGIPEYVMQAGRYTPNIAKHISTSPEMKAILEGGIIFDGLPDVKGNNIYIKTKSLKESVSGLNKSMGLASKVSGAMGLFPKPDGNFETNFEMGSRADDGFAISQSPFDGQVQLGGEEEFSDEGTEQKETSDQGQPEPEVQDMSGEGVPKLHEDGPDDRPVSGS